MPPGGFPRSYLVRVPLWEAHDGHISAQGQQIWVDVHVPGHGGYSPGPTGVVQLKAAIVGSPEAWEWPARRRGPTLWMPNKNSPSSQKFKWRFAKEISPCITDADAVDDQNINQPAPVSLYGNNPDEFRLVLAVDNLIVREYTDDEAVDHYDSPTKYQLCENPSKLMREHRTELCILPRNSLDSLRKWWLAAGGALNGSLCPVLSITPAMVCPDLEPLAIPVAAQPTHSTFHAQVAYGQIDGVGWHTACEDDVIQHMKLIAQQPAEPALSLLSVQQRKARAWLEAQEGTPDDAGFPLTISYLPVHNPGTTPGESQSSQLVDISISLCSAPAPHSLEDLQGWFRRAGGSPAALHYPGNSVDVSGISEQHKWWASPVIRAFILGISRRWDLGARMVQHILSYLTVEFHQGWQSMPAGAVWISMKEASMLAHRVVKSDHYVVLIDDYLDDPEELQIELREMQEAGEHYELVSGDPVREFWGPDGSSPDDFAKLRAEWKQRDKGCFIGSSLVKMASGTQLRMREVQPGSCVASPTSERETAIVECVVSYKVGSQVELCNVNGCWLTPEHLVKLKGQWELPNSRYRPEFRNLEDGLLYNLMLRAEDGHSVLVDGVEAVTLGHGLQRGPLAHPVWGTAVRPFLQAHPGYPTVVFEEDEFTVDAILGQNGGACLCLRNPV